MGKNIKITPIIGRPVWTSLTLWRPHLVTSPSDSFNLLSYLAAIPSNVLSGAWWFTLFAPKAGNPESARHALQFSFKMPEDYIDGSDIKVRAFWTSSEGNATSEEVEWQFGLCKNNGVALGTESETEYKTTTSPIPTALNVWGAARTDTLTFSAPNLTSDDLVSLIVLRDEGSGGDTADSNAYLMSVEVVYLREHEGFHSAADGPNREMTPNLFVPLYRNVDYQTEETGSIESTHDGSTASPSTKVLLNDRWTTLSFTAAAKQYTVINWIAPPDLKDNSTVKLTVTMVGSSTSSNGVKIRAGICHAVISQELPREGVGTGVEWIDPDGGNPHVMSGTVNLEERVTFSFAELIHPGEPVAIMFLRDGINDTYPGVLNTLSYTISYQSENNGVETLS